MGKRFPHYWKPNFKLLIKFNFFKTVCLGNKKVIVANKNSFIEKKFLNLN
ncbi:MAG: hypothetical protein CM15mP70_14310 [Pelagibacteraceae bacterium]|nr:MAG: hypothetical protein CM15mP70_14310 [Pelagibacteraceae bacterium]